MSANLDNIDLNSDVLSGEPANDVRGVNNISEVRTKVGLSSAAETLMDNGKNDKGQNQEAVVDEVKDFKGDCDLKEVVAGGLGREGKMDSADGSVDLKGENGSGSGVDDGSAQEDVAETSVTHSSKVEEEGSFKIEEEVKEGDCGVASSSSGGEDDIQVKNAHVEVKVDNANDLLPHKEPGNVSSKIISEGVESQVMEIDDEDSEAENEDAAAFDEGVLQENENLESNESNLVKEVGADGNATSDVNTKMASKEAGLSVGDLVWGKVRSHPWWPGQVFGRSDASKKAKKYFKKDSYLIAYFGDQTFAWNEVSKIKPFRCNFSQLEKQSNLEDFHDAVHCALDEVSRRVEFGLACPCMPEYSKIKTQIIVNPGIREESCKRDGGDSFSNAACFEPPKLIEYVKELGQLLLCEIDMLEFVTARSQLLVFNRWKGYSHLPELQILGELLESDAEIPQSAEVEHGSEMVENTATKVKDEPVSSGKEKPKNEDHSSRKRKHISGDKEHPNKKEKSLADLIAERRSSAAKGKGSLDGEATGKITTSSSGKKRKAVNSISDYSMMKQSKSPSSSRVDNGSSQPKKTYRVGESILRVASQLNGSTPILKSVNETYRKNAEKTKSQEKSASKKSKASPDELVSQLCLIARDPVKGCNILKSVVSFFVKFKNSQHIQSSLEHIPGGDVGELSTIVETQTTDSEHMKDSQWTDKTTESNPKGRLSHENKNEAREIPTETPTKDSISTFRKQSAAQLEHILECKLHIAVPSETNLNRIFSHFVPLKEMEIQVLKKSKRAKVVFRRSADAETALGSAGKYSVFGPSLVSYRPKYITSTKEQNFSIEEKTLSLIDVSFEDDCLYNSPSHDFHVRFSETKAEAKNKMGFAEANNTQSVFDGGELGPDPIKSMEPERVKKNTKYNLRKSLAWNSAFFTSAGVLEPEELSSMIGCEKHMLPGIEEDIHTSSDSISTLASDNLTLMNLEEADLFGDIRASIQRSTKGPDIENSSSKVGSPKTESKTVRSSEKVDVASRNKVPALEKVDVASRNKVKAKAAPNKPNAVMQGTEKTAKLSVPINGESKSLCRPPKIVGRIGPILAQVTKRASLGTNHVKVERNKDNPENAKKIIGRGAKAPDLSGPTRPTLPVKSSMRSSSAMKPASTASSSIDSSGSLSSDCSSKYSMHSVRRESDSRTGNHSSSGSNVKTTLKFPSRSKNQSTCSHLSPYMKSVTKLSSSISPASSISEWSSASLSPTSTHKKKSNSSRSSFDISSCKDDSMDSDASQVLDSQNHCHDENSVGHGTQVRLPGECVKKVPTGRSSVLHPDSAKPSGLRLPSPKIGFFDGVRPAARTPNKSKQSHTDLPSGLPGFRAGNVSPCGGSNNAKLGKLQPARTVARGTKISDQAAALGMKSKSPSPLQESSNAAPRASSALKNEKHGASKILKVHNRVSFQGERKSNLKAEKIGSEECGMSLKDSERGFTGGNENAFSLKVKNETERSDAPGKDTKITHRNGLPDKTTALNSIPKDESMTSLEKVGEDVVCSQNYIKNSLASLHGTNENKKASTEDQVDGLTKQIGAVDFYIEMRKEARGDSLSLSYDDVGRDASGIQEEFKQLSNPTCSPNPAMASTIVEAEKAKAGIEKASFEDQADGLTKQIGAVYFHLEMRKEAVGDSRSPSQDDVSRVDSGIYDEFKELPKPTCSPVPAMASSMVEADKAEAGIHKAFAEDEVDGSNNLILSQDDVSRVDSHVREQFKELSKPTCSPTPAISSAMVEAEKAEAGTDKASVEDPIDGLIKQIGALDIHLKVHKEVVGDSLSLSKDGVSRVNSCIQEEFKELLKPACSPTPAMASAIVEAQMAEATTLLNPATTHGKSKDGETS
ncbi:hypothetical protein SADUNF_Sadunf06G0107900 [Salix dunnii]|uniref:PWWP domain-containing protein n=1 Tax=Salix dunnii TaxID=1413687 RepID=A0A835JZF0_9ROSI|nr:hypothetical protein SADUNF_Sadunf06G0107900 [Salix dunnii]